MKYNFKNTKTNQIIVKEFPMSEVPSSLNQDGVTFTRDFVSEYKNSKPGIIIPRHMRAV